MRTEAVEGRWSGWRWTAMLVAAVAALMAILAIQTSAGAHDHRIPQTALKKGARDLQPGTRVAESVWVYPSSDDLCANETTFYRWRFPEIDRVAAGSTLKVRIFKAQKPDSFEIAAYRELDKDGVPAGEAQMLNRTLERVVQDGKTVAWDAVFEVRRADRDYYLVSEGHWKDREGCGGDQFAFWSFHVKTRA